jgi:tartrate-resistant acid phosphatase type 5
MRPVHVTTAALIVLAAACGGLDAVGDREPDSGASDASTDATVTADGTTSLPETGADAGADARIDAADAGDAADAADAADASDAADAEVEAGPPDPVLVTFAVVGDYGNGSGREMLVANLIASWAPAFVVTTGDNDYATVTHAYDDDVGQFYHSFIAPYAGAYGAGAAENAFFPAIGNHDWDLDDGAAYLDFFELPGNERYFELDKGPVHFVFLDSDTREPDGTTPASTQGAWAQAAIAASAAPFQFVVFHHPAYTSGSRTPGMDWPFKAWGADTVFTGHVHNYERLRSAAGLQYFVNGQGGVTTHAFGAIHPSSELRYNAKDGAQLVEVGLTHARFRYYDVDGTLQDDVTLDPSGNRIP